MLKLTDELVALFPLLVFVVKLIGEVVAAAALGSELLFKRLLAALSRLLGRAKSVKLSSQANAVYYKP